MTEDAISIKNLTVAYHEQPVLFQVDINFKAGQRTAIVGPNGAGKSTLIKAMLDLEKRLTGEITFFDRLYQKVKKEIAYVPQKSAVDWDFPTDVLDVVKMGRYGHLGWFKRPKKRDTEIALEKLDLVGMTDFKHRQINQLSGGQKQRVFLARALAQEAAVYILDEPLAGVDMKTETVIMDLLETLAKQNKTIIVVHHDLRTVPDYFDEIVFLNQTVLASGPVTTVFTEENIDQTYRQRECLGGE